MCLKHVGTKYCYLKVLFEILNFRCEEIIDLTCGLEIENGGGPYFFGDLVS